MDVSVLSSHETIVTKVSSRAIVCMNSGCEKSWSKYKKENATRHKSRCASTCKVLYTIPVDIWAAINVETQAKIRELVTFFQTPDLKPQIPEPKSHSPNLKSQTRNLDS